MGIANIDEQRTKFKNLDKTWIEIPGASESG